MPRRRAARKDCCNRYDNRTQNAATDFFNFVNCQFTHLNTPIRCHCHIGSGTNMYRMIQADRLMQQI
jgi:hypothetical protein